MLGNISSPPQVPRPLHQQAQRCESTMLAEKESGTGGYEGSTKKKPHLVPILS